MIMAARPNRFLPPPDPEHLRWCENLVRTIKHNGIWGIPRSQLVFQIDHEKKQLRLVSGDPEHPDVAATRHIFSYLGWDVDDSQ